MLTHSESLTALAKALAKAQGEMENAAKTSNNPFFRSKYADLAEIINTVRPVLAKHGLSVVQIPGFDGSTVTVASVLLHESGEWLSGVSGAPISIMTTKDGRELPPSPQGVGSAVTYLRRYSLAAICAIAQEDDDGNAASQHHDNQSTPMRQLAGEAPQGHVSGFEREKQNGNGFSLNSLVPVGKHKGKTWATLVELQPDYVEWAIKNLSRLGNDGRQALQAALDERDGVYAGADPMPPMVRPGTPLSEPGDSLPFAPLRLTEPCI